MPVLLYSNYYENFSPDMNNIKYSKQYATNVMASNAKLYQDNQYLNALRSNAYNQPVDAKSLEGIVASIKSTYKNNIDLMIKLKNNFTTTPLARPAPVPLGMLPPPAPAPPPAPVAPPPPVSTSPYLPLSAYFGFGKSKSKRGGRVGIIETYGVGSKILTLIDTIQNNVNSLKQDMMKLITYKQYLSPTNIREIVALHNQFFNYFDENIVPFRMAHIIPPFSTSLIGIDYTEIIDKLNELYVNYYNSFNRMIIPNLTNS